MVYSVSELLGILVLVLTSTYLTKKLDLIPTIQDILQTQIKKFWTIVKNITSIKERILITAYGKRYGKYGCKNALRLNIDSTLSIETIIEIKNLSIFDVVVKSIDLSIGFGNEPIAHLKNNKFDIHIKKLGTNTINPNFIPIQSAYNVYEKSMDVWGTIGFKRKYGTFEKRNISLTYAFSDDSKEQWRAHEKKMQS